MMRSAAASALVRISAAGLAGRGEDPGGLLAEDLEEHGFVGLARQAEPGLGPLGPLAELLASRWRRSTSADTSCRKARTSCCS